MSVIVIVLGIVERNAPAYLLAEFAMKCLFCRWPSMEIYTSPMVPSPAPDATNPCANFSL